MASNSEMNEGSADAETLPLHTDQAGKQTVVHLPTSSRTFATICACDPRTEAGAKEDSPSITVSEALRRLIPSIYIPTVLFCITITVIAPILPLYARRLANSDGLVGLVVASGNRFHNPVLTRYH